MRALPPMMRAQEEDLVNAAILSGPAWAGARAVLLYRAKPPELSVTSLGNGALRDGKRVVFPRVEPGGLVLREVASWDDLEVGAYGIHEPKAGCPVVSPADIDVAIVPGVAFTRAGDRLGQGGGFYDRLLPTIGGVSVGVAFDCQLVDVLPVEAHDRPVDEVVWPAMALAQAASDDA